MTIVYPRTQNRLTRTWSAIRGGAVPGRTKSALGSDSRAGDLGVRSTVSDDGNTAFAAKPQVVPMRIIVPASSSPGTSPTGSGSTSELACACGAGAGSFPHGAGALPTGRI